MLPICRSVTRVLKYIKIHVHITVDTHTGTVKVNKYLHISRVKISVKEYFIKHLLIYKQIQNMNSLKNIKDKENILSYLEKVISLMFKIHKDLILRRGSYTFISDFPIDSHLPSGQTHSFQAPFPSPAS